MKKALLLTLAALTSMHFVNAQTKQVTVDANDALNNNTKIVAQTSIGQVFFTGHQLGSGYSYPGAGIFRAWTDQPIGSANYYYDGVTNGTINFSVRADGQGYFAGNVGIGTASPDAKLTVFSSIPLGSSPKNSVLLSSISSRAGATNNFRSNIWLVRNSSGNDWVSARVHDGISIDASYMSPQTDTRTWWERAPNQDVQSWGTAANTYLTINKGNVGIGISTPTARLHIYNQYDVDQPTALKMFYQGTWGTPTYASNFRFIDLNSTESGKVLQVNGTGIGIGFDPPAWSTADKLYVNGNVGIGTTDPRGYKLAVNGSVIATSMTVKLNSAWGDYVFEPDYHLPTLTEVKTYVDQNHHLPEIPSAQEIAKDGLNLGEMNKLLMKKVEELTLYLIEMKSEIKELQKQNESLEKSK